MTRSMKTALVFVLMAVPTGFLLALSVNGGL
jgi:hypothetical protein